ncbi:MAG: hypothetical protein ICV60_15450 [Pyrinomonadaceae bacterium]|nr:hypothetical protein [Pyrinomonadaceae bacterium]
MSSTSPGTLPYSYSEWWHRPQAHDRPPLYWHVASRTFALLMWATPRPYRFGAARMMARALTPLVSRTAWYRHQRQLRMDGVSEIALHYALTIMSHSGALFDLNLKVEGAEKLDAALKKGQGVLVVGSHALLSLSLFRYLYDIGCVPAIISTAPFIHIYGKRMVACAIQPSPAFMIGLRSILRGGGVVCAMIDQHRPIGQRTIEFSTPEGPVYISDALIRLARRCSASIIFTAVRVDSRRGVILSFGAPEPASARSVEAIAEDFAAFLREHIAAVASQRSAAQL